MRTTYMPSAASIERKWYVVDASGLTLGRLSSEVAKILRGKNKPIYTPFMDTGDYVIVINADKIVVTGKKMDQKLYTHHTGYIGGLKQVTLKKMLETKPTEVIKHAVKGMLPKTPRLRWCRTWPRSSETRSFRNQILIKRKGE